MGRFLPFYGAVLAGGGRARLGCAAPFFVPPAVPSAFLGAAPERGSARGLSRDGLRRVSSAPEREVCPRWLVVGVRLVGCVTAAFAALWFSLIRV